MANPTVSVIIPCYNGEATIGETLESLQKQTFCDWEAIVVNDGSTDGSVEMIRRYRANDSRIQQVDQENQGLSAARNAGLALAKGELVNFLDADDLLLPGMLQRMVQKLNEDTSLGAVHCGWINSDPKVQDLSWVFSPRHEGQLFEKLTHYNLFPCHSVLLRSKILENVGLFDCSLRQCEDWDLWLRVARAGAHFGYVCEPLVIYRMTPVSLSRNPVAFFQAGKEVIRRGHDQDRRVKKPAPQFIQGCECPMMKELTLKWLLYCIGFMIVKGDYVQASGLLETTLKEENLQITPYKMKSMAQALWFGTAIPQGNWNDLWPRISGPLLQFLLRQEERLKTPGFAMKCLREIIGLNRLQLNAILETMNGRKLFKALMKKILRRLFRPWKERYRKLYELPQVR